MSALIFLSHIHEETELAQIIQKSIEDEFSGFVDVFVSSDGKTIPPGANFLKRIEDGLINCVGAIYLISPFSVKRNWINFELGAVWIRNSINVQKKGIEIPVIPICHSGITPSGLPMPLMNLNAILASVSSQLELMFVSIQNAVGGKGILKTDFDKLAKQIIEFERQYTVGENLIKLIRLLQLRKEGIKQLIDRSNSLGKNVEFPISLGFKDNHTNELIKNMESNELKGKIKVMLQNGGMVFGTSGAQVGAQLTIVINSTTLLEFAKHILNNIAE